MIKTHSSSRFCSHLECLVTASECCELGKLYENAGELIETAETRTWLAQPATSDHNSSEPFSAQHHERREWCDPSAQSQRSRPSVDRIIDSFYGCEWIRTGQHQAQVELRVSTGTSAHHSDCDDEHSVHDWHHRRGLLDGQWVASSTIVRFHHLITFSLFCLCSQDGPDRCQHFISNTADLGSLRW